MRWKDHFQEREITLPIIPLFLEFNSRNSQLSNMSFNLPASNPMVPQHEYQKQGEKHSQKNLNLSLVLTQDSETLQKWKISLLNIAKSQLRIQVTQKLQQVILILLVLPSWFQKCSLMISIFLLLTIYDSSSQSAHTNLYPIIDRLFLTKLLLTTHQVLRFQIIYRKRCG